ncbi:MAG: hypothetical protein IJZ04_04595 [Clostridia bacterium]|nr:hypothetical protein [Clostridia bacterium]
MKKDIIGIDLGREYSSFVHFSIEKNNGRVIKSPIRSLMKGVAHSDDERGIRSVFRYDSSYKSSDPKMGERMVEDFLMDPNDKKNEGKQIVTWYIGEEAFAWCEDQKLTGNDEVGNPRAVKVVLNDRIRDDSISAYDEYYDEETTSKLEITNSNVETSLFFAEIFFQIFRANQEIELSNAKDVEFVIGSPPGCGRAYAEELKRCVKNGFLLARKKYNKLENDDVSLKSACYPEPVLAGYAWFQNNDSADGLLEGESALVVDIGGGTADFAYVERVNGKIRAMKYAIDDSGERRLIQCRGTELGSHAGERFDDALADDIRQHAKDKVGRDFIADNARDVKEILHSGSTWWKAVERSESGVENSILVYRGKAPSSKDDSKIPPLDFDELIKGYPKSKSHLAKEFYELADVVEKYCGSFNVPTCSKVLFVGGSSKIDSLKDIIASRLDKCARERGNQPLERCDLNKLSEEQTDMFVSGLELNPFTAVAIGACLAYEARESLVVAPSLRMYIYNDGDRYEAHCLINNLSECMGPLVITSDEIEEYISDSILRVNFMEDGALVYKDGNKEVNAFDDETVSLFNLEIPNAEQRSRGVTFVDANGRELYDSGKPWPINQAKDGDYHEIKEEISINIRSASKADLIILPSKHGRDINRTYVYYLQKIKVRGKNDGEEIPLTVYDSLRNQEYSFKIESYDENGQPLALSKDEKAFNEKAKFHKSNASHTYYYVATKIGANNCKKVILDKILSGELVLNDADKEEFLKILNGNWKKEDK